MSLTRHTAHVQLRRILLEIIIDSVLERSKKDDRTFVCDWHTKRNTQKHTDREDMTVNDKQDLNAWLTVLTVPKMARPWSILKVLFGVTEGHFWEEQSQPSITNKLNTKTQQKTYNPQSACCEHVNTHIAWLPISHNYPQAPSWVLQGV